MTSLLLTSPELLANPFEAWRAGLQRDLTHQFAQSKPAPDVRRSARYGEIHPLVRRWIEAHHAELILEMYQHRCDQYLTVNGHAYRIEALLGAGSEAEIYLIERDSELRVAKVFDSHYHYKAQRTWARLSTALPTILERDERAGVFLLVYREGIPVNWLERIELDLPPGEQVRLASLYESFVTDQAKTYGLSFPPSNAIYLPRVDWFQVIDPH